MILSPHPSPTRFTDISMLHRFAAFVFAFCLMAIFALPAHAQGTPVNVDVKDLEKKLGSITTMRADFTQTDPSGKTTTGKFYLSRPGKLRFEYDPPVEDFIVADGVFIYFYDGTMKEQANTLISNSLADFILRKNLNLTGDLRMMGATESNGMLFVKLAQASDVNAGTITLGLQMNPFALRGWRIVDAQGGITEIKLDKVETGGALPSSLFAYRDPQSRKLNR